MAGLDPAIHDFAASKKDVDAYRGFCETPGGSGNEVPARARVKPGHDNLKLSITIKTPLFRYAILVRTPVSMT
jgi:hypothetical protein